MGFTDRDKIKKTVIEIVAAVLEIPEADISEDMELDADLRIDSLALYEIVVEAEDRFSMRISNDEADGLNTVGEAIDFIAGRAGRG